MTVKLSRTDASTGSDEPFKSQNDSEAPGICRITPAHSRPVSNRGKKRSVPGRTIWGTPFGALLEIEEHEGKKYQRYRLYATTFDGVFVGSADECV
jgi:hypothetical protein